MSVAAVFSLDSTEPSFLVISVFIVAFVPSLIGIFTPGTSNLPFWIDIGVWLGSCASYTLFLSWLRINSFGVGVPLPVSIVTFTLSPGFIVFGRWISTLDSLFFSSDLLITPSLLVSALSVASALLLMVFGFCLITPSLPKRSIN